MTKVFKGSLMLVWIGWMGFGLAAGANAENSKPRLAVCVHNNAGVPSATLKKAERIAQRIFEHAGVETIWTQSEPLGVDAEANCPANSSTTSWPWVEVNLIDHTLGLRNSVLGLAPGNNNEVNRSTVYVFDQVANRIVQEESIADIEFILGHAMAHEIGHILAQIETHSNRGLMRAKWHGQDFEEMVRGRLIFDSDQAARIRDEVTRRTRVLAMPSVATNSR